MYLSQYNIHVECIYFNLHHWLCWGNLVIIFNLISLVTSLILIPSSQKAVITPGIIFIYRQMITYTISDLNDAEESFGYLSLSKSDKEAFLRICINSWKLF